MMVLEVIKWVRMRGGVRDERGGDLGCCHGDSCDRWAWQHQQ